MLTHLRIRNFKAWEDTGPIRLAPLTVIFGANSAGKSSLGHLLLGLKQTAALTDRRRALHLGDMHSLVDLGSFEDCLHGHDLKARLEFALGWRLARLVQFQDPIEAGEVYAGDRMLLESVLRASASGAPELESFRYELRDASGESRLVARHGVHGNGKPYLDVEPMKLVRKQGLALPVDMPEKFYRFSDMTLARYRNADSLSQFPLALENLLADLSYLGPLREPPRRTYAW